ncbi:MAG TPA: ABC transporter ATP-binding protein [Steroidobacteraceae bacterium]|jgi:iron complex transport system ATP-binding protein|nr:ABC transporter ATP-binding protein [Steroidobacteraceae bacterium]
MSILHASRISVRRGARVILDDVSLHAESGDFVAVIGANGAGKSTLLSVLAGLLKPDAGSVALDGISIHAISGLKLAQRRAYLPQNPRCEWPISVERLVALGLTPTLPALGSLPASFAPRITQALQACDLMDHREQPATTLSGGELARAMLARALVAEPEVLIIDEPIAGLDPKHALDTARRLQLLAKGGKLVIASLHDLTLAGRYASRIFALTHGRVQGDGSTEATLTPELIRSAFEVEACVSGTAGSVYVDYALPP